MPNKDNLIPQAHKLTDEERTRGGKKSGETRRLQSAIRKALDSRADSAEFCELFEQFKIKKGSRDYASAIACAGIKKAAKGDLGWAGFIRDMLGENPKDSVGDTGDVVIIDDIGD